MPFFSGLRGRGPAPAAAFFMPASDSQAAAPLLESWFRRLQADHARVAAWPARRRTAEPIAAADAPPQPDQPTPTHQGDPQ